MTHSFGERMSYCKRALLVGAGVIALLSPLMVGLLHAQAPNSFSGLATIANKKFEVATIKLNLSGSQGWRLGPPAKGSVSIDNLELKKIIASSFRIQDSMVFGPGWIESTHYDIVGKGPDATVANPEVWEMMRSLLAERFHMKYHLESRETPVYALTVAKDGMKLRKPEEGQCAEAIRAGQNCGDIMFFPYGVGIYNMPIGALIGGLGRKLQDRPIVDKTGLTGKYDINVMWLPDGVKLEDTRNAPKEMQPEDISLFEAMEKQAGLKLERQKLPIQVVVIDSIDRPTEN